MRGLVEDSDMARFDRVVRFDRVARFGGTLLVRFDPVILYRGVL